MKKALFFISSLVMTSVFAGCSKDEEKGNPEALIGTWEYVSIAVAIDGQPVSSDTEIEETMTFYADGTVESTIDGKGTYTTNGYSITFILINPKTGKQEIQGPGQTVEISAEESGLEVNLTGKIKKQTYSVNGNTLTFKLVVDFTYMGKNISSVSTVVYKKVTDN